MQQRHQRRITTRRQREALELRDACMLLAARHGAQREVGGAPVLEAGVGPFTVRLTPGGARRALEVRHAGTDAGAGAAPVLLELRWSGDGLEVVAFRRGAWEAELLGLTGRRPPR
jgi:hypothetical protein